MNRCGKFDLASRRRSGERRTARRLGMLAGLMAAGVGAVLVAGLLGPKVASAGNPMTVSGVVSTTVVGSQTVAARVGGKGCAGASAMLPDKVYAYSVTLASSCGTDGEAVTFTVNGAAAGLQTSAKKNCLRFDQGSTVTDLTIIPGGTPDTSCAAPSPSPTPSATPKASPKPLPDPLVLTPSFSTTSTEYYWDENSSWYCLQAAGLFGYGAAMPVGKVQVGYVHYDDPGTDPLPCWIWEDSVNRAAVGFDWDKVQDYVKGHGFKSMVVHFSVEGGGSNCVAMVMINNDRDSRHIANPYDGLLPGGFLAPGQPEVDGSGFKMDETGWLVLNALPENAFSIDADSHFVFMGLDESLSEQDNNYCDATLHDFTLTVTPDH